MEDMDKIKKQLVFAMMLADLYRKQNEGILINAETKIMIEGKEFHYKGNPAKVKEGSVISFFDETNKEENFLVIDGDVDELNLEKVTFFKATLLPNNFSTYCVVAKDLAQAFVVLKNYIKANDMKVTRILDMKPCTLFQPVITRLM